MNNSQKNILIGIILGDGTLIKKYNNSQAYLKFTQSYKNKEYLYHVFNQFKDICNMREPSFYTFKDTKYSYYSFSTKSLPELTNYYNLFYHNRTKVIPLDIKSLLTPEVIAY